MTNTYYRLMLAFVLCITSSFCAGSFGDTPEIVAWPYQTTNELYVARDTTDVFYITAYNRGMDTHQASDVEIIVPENWQVWPLDEAPPTGNPVRAANHVIKGSLFLQDLSRKGQPQHHEYALGQATGYLAMAAHPLPNAVDSILKIRWMQGANVLAAREITLKPINFGQPFGKVANGKMRVGLWLGYDKVNPETMYMIYQGLRRAGIDYLITSKKAPSQTRNALKTLGIKNIINQWWSYRSYLPVAPPPEAYSTLKDGSIDRARWSPTYMAEGGPAFIKAVENIADELHKMDGIYGLMLDYEPGAIGLDADYGEQSRVVFEKYLGQKVLSWPADVLTNGKYEEEWINFRNDQSEAYVRWFQKIIKKRAPKVHLMVSTSGATGKPDDPNRVLAATDITQLSRVSDSIHPQLYSWTSKLPAQLKRFEDKLKLGQTTIAGSHAPVYPAVGSMYGNLSLSDPKYLRTQILNWWFHGSSGFEIWTDAYGVDGRYLAMVNEMAHIFREAGERPKDSSMENTILNTPSSDNLKILQRMSPNGKSVWVGLFNFDSKPIKVPLKTRTGWRLSDTKQTTATIAPWTACVVKCLPNN